MASIRTPAMVSAPPPPKSGTDGGRAVVGTARIKIHRAVLALAVGQQCRRSKSRHEESATEQNRASDNAPQRTRKLRGRIALEKRFNRCCLTWLDLGTTVIRKVLVLPHLDGACARKHFLLKRVAPRSRPSTRTFAPGGVELAVRFPRGRIAVS